MTQDDRQPGNTAARTLRDRVGLSIWAANPPSLVQLIEQAESAGVAQIWTTQGPVSHDTLTAYAVALVRTSRIRLGTSIVPTYPRHPLALAQQAATAASFGSDRLRLGVGPSHRPSIEGAYGIRMEAPLEHLREYVNVLRAALWDGTVEHQGRFITAKATSSSTTQIPLLVSALGEGAFRLAGEISDGAISWNCPPSYLLDVAFPALRDGARAARRTVPPLVAHVWVALSTDRVAVRLAARKRLATYARLPFYANMFAASGFPVQADGTLSDDLIDNLVVMGDESTVTARLNELLASGLDELLVSLVPLEDGVNELTRTFDLIGRL
jgi:F420-dependent oxidoreductase-like protein